MTRATTRPIRTMRRSELVAEASRLGIKNVDGYNVGELRLVVAAKLVSEAMGEGKS